MVQFGTYIINEGGEILSERSFPRLTLDNPSGLFLYFACTMKGVWSLCDKIYKRAVLNGLDWLNTVMADDYYCSAQLFLKAEKFMAIKDVFYYYVQHPSSIMHQSYMMKEKREDCINGHDIVINLAQRNFPEFVPDLLLRKLKDLQSMFISCSESNSPDKHEVLKQLKEYLRETYKLMNLELKKQHSNLNDRPKLANLSEEYKYSLKDKAIMYLFSNYPSFFYKFYLAPRLKLHTLTGI